MPHLLQQLPLISLWAIPPLSLALMTKSLLEGQLTLTALAALWCYSGARCALLCSQGRPRAPHEVSK